MPLDFPLRFRPLLKRAIWGGRNLGDLLGKPIGPEADYAESWEVVDRRGEQGEQSVVVDDPQAGDNVGDYAGRTLGELVRTCGPELLGRHHPQSRFPLLFKFLDCRAKLSVQVHPNDAQAARLTPPDLGKTEAWVILSAEPGSVIYAGLKRGFDRRALEREVHRGTCELCLHRFEPRPGDCLFLPAGVVHAPGGGIVMAEIQQSSDVTFRLYDWNRTGPDGRPRPLHVEQGLDAIDYDFGPAGPQMPQATDDPRVERLVECEQFVLDRWTLAEESIEVPTDDRCRILAVIDGSAEIGGRSATRGDTLLVPAACRSLRVAGRSRATILLAYLP